MVSWVQVCFSSSSSSSSFSIVLFTLCFFFVVVVVFCFLFHLLLEIGDGGAGLLLLPRRPTIWIIKGQGPTVLAGGAGFFGLRRCSQIFEINRYNIQSKTQGKIFLQLSIRLLQ